MMHFKKLQPPTNKKRNQEFLGMLNFLSMYVYKMKHNIIGIPFITKYIPTTNILGSKNKIKDKYTRLQNTALTFFQRMNK